MQINAQCVEQLQCIGYGKMLAMDASTSNLCILEPSCCAIITISNLHSQPISVRMAKECAVASPASMPLQWPSSQALFINGQVHLFGGLNNRTHRIWDAESRQLRVMFTFAHEYGKEGLHGFGLHHVPSRDMVLLFGGCGRNKYDICSDIWKYDIARNQWSRLPLTLPVRLCRFGSVLSPDESTIVILGGVRFGSVPSRRSCSLLYTDSIYIWDLSKVSIRCSKENPHIWDLSRIAFRESTLKCAVPAKCMAVLTHKNYDADV